MKTQLFLSLTLATLTYAHADLAKIAVADFSSNEGTRLTYGLADQLTDDLVNTGLFEVYERDKLNTVMREQGFQGSGNVDPQSAVALGKVMGIQYIVTGQISDFGQESKSFSGYGVRSTTTYYRLKAGIKLIDVETGRILFSRNGTAEESVVQGQSSRVRDDTVDVRLAETVSSYLVGELINHDIFKKEQETNTTASIRIDSSPENADVEIDGVFYGNAGTSYEIPQGLHTITVSLPGYEVWSKKVMVKDGLNFTANLIKRVDARIEIEIDDNTE